MLGKEWFQGYNLAQYTQCTAAAGPAQLNADNNNNTTQLCTNTRKGIRTQVQCEPSSKAKGIFKQHIHLQMRCQFSPQAVVCQLQSLWIEGQPHHACRVLCCHMSHVHAWPCLSTGGALKRQFHLTSRTAAVLVQGGRGGV